MNKSMTSDVGALVSDCIERVRCRAAPEEWETVKTRLAELERQLVD
jgi:hypothetical protein